MVMTKNREDEKMKTRILSCLFLCLMFAGCVPTPEEEIVVGKNTEEMIAAAATLDSERQTEEARYEHPDRYAIVLNSIGGKLTVTVDAAVIVPDGPLPIVRAAPSRFNEDDVRRFIPPLLGEDPYYYDGVYPKSYWRQRLDEAIDAIDHWDTYGKNYFNEYDTVEEARKGLERLNKQLNEAPDEPVRVDPDFSFLPITAFNKDGPIETSDNYVSARFVDPSGSYGTVWFSNNREVSGTAEFEYYRDSDRVNRNYVDTIIDVTKDLSVSKPEAERQAVAIAEKLGFSDFALTESYGANAFYNGPGDYAPVWTFVFTRCFKDAQVTYINHSSITHGMDYQKALQDEVLFIDIDDNGLYYLRYEGPLTILDTVAEQTNLKPFSEIQTIFERMVVLKDNEADHPETGESHYTERYVITEVRLGLALVREQNKDTVLLVPAWDFLGHSEITWTDGQVTVVCPDDNGSFLTINAIDGSIIDRANGY